MNARPGPCRCCTVFGWQKPCYLLGEGYAKTFKELMEGTEWEKYGVGKYEKCANCMVHCGFEGTAATDAIKHPLKIAAVLMRGREDRRPDGAGDRPVTASVRRSSSSRAMSRRRCQRSGPANPTPQRSRQRSSSANALFEARAVRISAGTCTGISQQRAQHRGRCAMPPSGFIATRAAGGSTWAASSEITRSPANGRLRACGEASGDVAFHVHSQCAGGGRKAPALVSGIFDDHIAAEEMALMGLRQARQQPTRQASVTIPGLACP